MRTSRRRSRAHRALCFFFLLAFACAGLGAHAHAHGPQVSGAQAQLAPHAATDAAPSVALAQQCALCHFAHSLVAGDAHTSHTAPPLARAAKPALRTALFSRHAARAHAPRAPPLLG